MQFTITFAKLLFLFRVVLTCGGNGTVVVGGHLGSIATFCVPCVNSIDTVVIVAHGHAG